MAPPIYGGIVNLDNGASTASIISGVLAPTGINELTSGVQFNPTATVATFGRGWTRSAFAAVDGSVFLVRAGRTGNGNQPSLEAYPAGIRLAVLSSATDYRRFTLYSNNVVRPAPVGTATVVSLVIAATSFLESDSVGSLNFGAITRVEAHHDGNGGNNGTLTLTSIYYCGFLIATEGDSGNPGTLTGLQTYLRATAVITAGGQSQEIITADVRSAEVFGISTSIQIGDGSTFTQFTATNFSLFFPTGITAAEFTTSRFCDVQVPPFWHIFRIKSSPTDIVNLTGSISCGSGFQFIVDPVSGSPSLTLTLNLFNASPVTLRSGVNFSGSLLNCGELAGNGATLSDLTIRATTGASGWNPALGSTATNVLVRNCNHGIRISSSGSYAAMGVTLRNNTIADVLVPTGVSGAINLSSVVFPVSGSTTPTNIRYEGTGTVTITVNRAGLTTSTPNGGTVVLVAPIIALTAPNFQQGSSVEVSRVNTYTLSSSGINIATGVITLSGHQFRSAGIPTLIALIRQPGAVLPTASTPFERVDPGGAITPLLLSVVNVSGNTFQLASSDGGAPITFSNAGSGNFTIQGFTRLDFSVAGANGYAVTLTEATGTLLEVKARFWQNAAGCTASSYYQARFIWSSVSGIAIADILTVADTPDTVHNTLIGRTLTLANGTTQTVTADGSAIAGMAANQNGIVSIDRASGLLITQDAYCWFVWYTSTSAGIRLTNKEALTADSLFDFVLTLIQIRNLNALALEWLGGYIRTNNGSRLIAIGSNAMYPNAGQAGIAIAVSSGGGGGGLDAAGVRSAIGLASANLDTQLSTANTNTRIS